MQEIHAHPDTPAAATASAIPSNPLFPWAEFVAGLFGFHGVGLILARKPTRGIIWLALSLVKHAVGAGLVIATFGLALACLLPLDIGLSIYLALSVARIQRHAQHAALPPAL